MSKFYEIKLNNSDTYFLCGNDDAGNELEAVKHVGMVCDSVLIMSNNYPDCIVRWFIRKDEIEFYKTYMFPDKVNFVNEGTRDIRIDKNGILKPNETMKVVMEK